MANPIDYSNVIGDLRSWYGVSSEEVWNIINQYNLTPEQLYQLAPNDFLGQGADGVYHMFLNNGESAGAYQQVTIPVANPPAITSQINSNAQTGTASTTVKTKWAGNSVIDSNGKVRTSAGVDKYANGSLLGKVGAVVATGTTAVAGWSIGMSLGKSIGKALYDADPVFFSAYSPENWNNITANMDDGVLKKAINYLLQIDDNGNTQAYLSQDAFYQIAYGLTKKGLFDSSSGIEYTWDDAPASSVVQQPLIEGSVFTYCGAPTSGSVPRCSVYTWQVHEAPIFYVKTRANNNPIYNCIALNPTDHAVTVSGTEIIYNSSGSIVNTRTNSYTIQPNSYNLIFAHGQYTPFAFLTVPSVMDLCNNVSDVADNASTSWRVDALAILNNGEKHVKEPLPGVDNQQGATSASIPSNASPQDVINYINNTYPDLYDNRIEQEVVNPDGTTKKVIYYPVPMPNKTEDAELADDKEVTITDEIIVVLPKGSSITLPNGTVVTGDGVSELTLPPGTYVLPEGTVIKNVYVYDDENPEGSSQTDPEVTAASTLTLLQLIVKMLTDAQPKSATEPQTDPSQDTSTDITNPNPTDIGDGNTPPNVVPVGSASALWSVYNPTQTEINALGSWLWSSNFVDQLLKMFSDPMQAIIGLHKTYIPPITGATHNIIVGYLDSGVSSLTVPTQYSTVDCGSIDLQEYFGNVFDYSPYTRVFIYLPFIGFKELDVSQVMRSRIGVRYTGDAYTGACLAEISVYRDGGAGGVLYTFGGDCAARYPLSSGSYMGIVSGIVGVAASAGMALGGMMNPMMGLGGMLGSFGSAKTRVETSGGFSGNTGAMGGKTPYLVVMRPQTAMANRYSHFTGQPANYTVKLKNTSGYVRVKEVHVEDISIATDEEKQMIESALKTGVIVS